MVSEPPRVRRLTTAELTEPEIAAIRALLVAAFGKDDAGRFADDDWENATGGLHFVLDAEGEIVAHASVVEREIHIGDRALRTGYVEAVATAPGRQGAGFGTVVMNAVASYIRDGFELGALSTGRHRFYERLGWRTWTGPSFVRASDAMQPTPEEDGSILVLATSTTPPLDRAAPISCDWRRGDVW
jgi:aminoglycoside 2'-N-acetyltransferase I